MVRLLFFSFSYRSRSPANSRRHITVENALTGETFEETADIVVACRGNLNDQSWPKIDGLETFKGEKMHSAAWNDRSVPCRNRNTVVDFCIAMTSKTRKLESLVEARVRYRSFRNCRKSRVLT